MDNLKFWCQTVLPLVYDDSLSYYELLNKVVKYLNSMISDVSQLQYVTQHTTARLNLLEENQITTQQTVSEHSQDITNIKNALTDINIDYYKPGDYVVFDNAASAYTGYVDALNVAHFLIPIAKPIQDGCDLMYESGAFSISTSDGYDTISGPEDSKYDTVFSPGMLPKWVKVHISLNDEPFNFVIGGETLGRYAPLTMVVNGSFRLQVINPPQ